MIQFLRGNPQFMRFWISTWTSELGDWVRNMSLMFIVLELSQGSAVAFSINMFCEFAPIFLFGFLVGAFVDRWDRKRTVLGAIVFRAIMMLFFIWAISVGSLYMIYTGSFVSAIGTLFFRASTPAFMMQFVPEEDRKMAANLRQMSMSTMLLIGSPIGTLFYMKIGASHSLLLTVLLFVAAWLLVQTVKVDNTASDTTKTRASIIQIGRDILEGFHYSWKNPILRPILFSNIFFGYGAGIVNVLEIFIITEYLGLPKEAMAILASVQGAGMLFSTFAVGKLKLPLDRLLSYGMVVMGIGLGGMVSFPSFFVTAGALVVFSLGQIGFNVGMATLMQTKVAFEYQGRSMMTVSTVFNGFMVLAMLTSGWLHEAFSIRPVVLGGGVMIILGGIICFGMFLHILKKNEQDQIQVPA